MAAGLVVQAGLPVLVGLVGLAGLAGLVGLAVLVGLVTDLPARSAALGRATMIASSTWATCRTRPTKR